MSCDNEKFTPKRCTRCKGRGYTNNGYWNEHGKRVESRIECGECGGSGIVVEKIVLATVEAAAPEYRHLKFGEVIEDGDEVDICNDGWRDEPKWVPAKSIGQKAPDPRFPSHRVYRRLLN